MKKRLLMILGVCIVLTAGMLALTGCGGSDQEEAQTEPETTVAEETVTTFAEADVPEAVMAKVDEVKGIVEKAAADLTPEFGDQYKALIESGEGDKYADYAAMKEQLDKIREDTGSTYVYTLSPGKDGVPSLDGETGEGAHFLIGIDGSEDPDPWGEDYEWEIQFEEAWNGQTAAARSAWADSDDGKELCWSAFAPIKDSDGNVVCILGVDYPANEILDYPEWNRDSDSWNKIEE